MHDVRALGRTSLFEFQTLNTSANINHNGWSVGDKMMAIHKLCRVFLRSGEAQCVYIRAPEKLGKGGGSTS